MHVILRAFAMAAVSDVHGEAMDIVVEESVSIRQLAGLIQEQLPTPVEYGEPRKGEIASARVSSEKARRLLGWQQKYGLLTG